MHKGFKCLDMSSGCIYISRDVVFDEELFPFSQLNPNAGAQLRQEIVLLPTHLLNHGDVTCVTNATNSLGEEVDFVQDLAPANSEPHVETEGSGAFDFEAGGAGALAADYPGSDSQPDPPAPASSMASSAGPPVHVRPPALVFSNPGAPRGEADRDRAVSALPGRAPASPTARTA